MFRINLPFVFTLATELEPLATLPDGGVKYGDAWLPLIIAESSIQGLTSSSVFTSYLRSSYPLSQELLAAIRVQTGHSPADLERQLGPGEIWSIKNLYAQYKTALLAELGSLNAYFVQRIFRYSKERL